MKVLIDMNLSPRWVHFLEDAGHDAQHWSARGRWDADDQEILDAARESGAVLLTQDLDFGTMLAIGGHALPSVIQIRAQATLPSDIGSQVLDTLNVAQTHLTSGALVTLTPLTRRISILPLGPAGGA